MMIRVEKTKHDVSLEDGSPGLISNRQFVSKFSPYVSMGCGTCRRPFKPNIQGYDRCFYCLKPEQQVVIRETVHAAWQRNLKLGTNVNRVRVALLKQQDGRCAVCGKLASSETRAFSVDHDHRSGLIRGALCDSCNFGLGSLDDSIPVLERAISYLRRSSSLIKAGSARKTYGHGDLEKIT